MTLQNQIYKCETCGNIVEVLHTGMGTLVCCGKSMVLQKENNKDFSQEKHIPVLTKNSEGITVKVGSVEHPMTEEHYIEWIEIITDKEIAKKFLNPGEKPEANFCVNGKLKELRSYCNLHGLWKSQ